MRITSFIKDIYNRLQKPLAIFCLIAGAIGTVITNQYMSAGALVTLEFILILILFEIHDLLTNKTSNTPKRFDNYHAAAPEMTVLIEKEINRNNKVTLKWLGTAMDYGWPFLRNYLSQIESSQKSIELNIEIAMLSHEWPDIKKVNRLWGDESKSYYESIVAYRKDIQHNSSNVKINVELYPYKHMPYFTGLLINDKFLFLGMCGWKHGQYSVGSNEYTLYKNQNGDTDKKHISQFKKWFEFAKENSNLTS